MTKHERETIIRAYWSEHAGKIGATDGARAISASHGIPVNTVRGYQNRMYPAGARPWEMEAREPVATCGKCSKAAYTDDEVVLYFGIRNMKYTRKDGTVKTYQSPQSYCRTCRTTNKRKNRAKS